MKSFVISVILFFILIFLCIWYSVYAVSICEEMKNEIASLEITDEKWNSAENRKHLSELISKWEKDRRVLSLGMEGKTLQRIEDLFLQLSAASEADSFSLYLNGRLRLMETLSEFALENTVSLSQFL